MQVLSAKIWLENSHFVTVYVVLLKWFIRHAGTGLVSLENDVNIVNEAE